MDRRIEEIEGLTINQALEVLRASVKADMQKARQLKRRNDELQQARKIAEKQARLHQALLQRIETAIEEMQAQNSMLKLLLTQVPISAAIAELTDEIGQGFDYITDVLMLIREGFLFVLPKVEADTTWLEGQFASLTRYPGLNYKDSYEVSLRKQLRRQFENLNLLLERKADHAGEPPVGLINQIETVRTEIETLEQKLNDGLTEAEQPPKGA